jgi:isopentenyl diphosphate isomerase/L-lactate dehydrogenase-like FMN-dependent dehydrogenase
VNEAGDPWPLSLADLEAAAAERLDPIAYDYFRSGAGEELTLQRNRAAWGRIELAPRVLRDVSAIDLGIELLGSRLPLPVIVAPTAFHGLAHPEAEPASATGAARAGALFCLSTLSNTAPEEVAAAAGPAPRWFQLYVFRDRGLTRELLARAAAAGFGAIVLTVDAPLLGRRERDVRNRFTLPEGLTIACVGDRLEATEGESGLAAYFASQLDPSLSFEDLEWLCAESALPVLVKGVLQPDDAVEARARGAAGVIVSNHGGRQLDTALSGAEALGPIAEQLGPKAAVIVDGGIRRGTDVVKALALGAEAVMVGRPILWGLALEGAAGVERVLAMLAAELREGMALCGAAEIAEIDAGLLARP